MSKLYFEIFDQLRKNIFAKLVFLKQKAVLAGGTAIALQLAHRYSYDFDIFTQQRIASQRLNQIINIFGKNIKRIVDQPSELSFLTKEKIKISLIYFPFPPLYPMIKTPSLALLNLKDLAANKAYTIGRRGEYRDYVDLFFLLKNNLDLKTIIADAQKKFNGAFSERLFLEQLVYLTDLKDEKVDFYQQSYSSAEIFHFLKAKVSQY